MTMKAITPRAELEEAFEQLNAAVERLLELVPDETKQAMIKAAPLLESGACRLRAIFESHPATFELEIVGPDPQQRTSLLVLRPPGH